MNAYDLSKIQRQITTAAMGNIQKYTDTDDYEFILMDNGTYTIIDTKYNCIEADQHIVNEKDIGFSASMNLGAKESNPDFPYICFIHNDVFVHEGWLPKLLKHLTEKKIDGRVADIVAPSQGYITRQQVLDSYANKIDRLDNDAGLFLMSKESFKKTGGWDERMKSVYQDYVFRKKAIKDSGLEFRQTSDVIITHIGYATIGLDDKTFEESVKEEGTIVDGEKI